MSVIDSYADQTNGIALLGNIVWCHVRNARIPRDDAKAIADGCGLEQKWLPKESAPPDVFRRATSEVSGLKVGSHTYLVRKVRDRGGEIVRHIIREERDERGKRLSYEQVGEMTFVDVVYNSRLIGNEDECARKIMDAAQKLYDDYLGCMTGDEIQRMIKRVLDSLSRVSVHPTGGVYFIPVFYAAELRSLQCFVKRIDKYSTGQGRAERNIFSIVPLPDLAEHREDVTNAFVSSFRDEVDGAIGELATILLESVNSKPADNLVSARAGQLAGLQSKLADYRKVIGESLQDADFRMDTLAEQVGQLGNLREVTFLQSAFAQESTKVVDGLVYNHKASYVGLVFKGRLLGRVRFSRSGVTMYTDVDLTGLDIGKRDEYKSAGEQSAINGWKITTNEPDVFGLFVKALADNSSSAPTSRPRKSRRASGAR